MGERKATASLNFLLSTLHTSHRLPVPSCELPRRAPTPPRLRTRGPYLVVESLCPTLNDVSNGVSSDTSVCIVASSGRPQLTRLSLIGASRSQRGTSASSLGAVFGAWISLPSLGILSFANIPTNAANFGCEAVPSCELPRRAPTFIGSVPIRRGVRGTEEHGAWGSRAEVARVGGAMVRGVGLYCGTRRPICC